MPRKRAKKDSAVHGPAEHAVDEAIEESVAKEARGLKYWLMKAEPESRIVKGKVEGTSDVAHIRMLNSALTISKK